MKTYAGFWQRAGAFGFDYVIILFYIGNNYSFFLLFNSPLRVNHLLFSLIHWMFANPIRAQITGFFLITLPVTLYFAISESSARQATWGNSECS